MDKKKKMKNIQIAVVAANQEKSKNKALAKTQVTELGKATVLTLGGARGRNYEGANGSLRWMYHTA